MKDKEIRKILVSYLQAQGKEMRIYQEKSIGNSICDLMVVTNLLTGYEIKSDGDNYQRLNTQIPAYDKFFDQNYIVIGATHHKSAGDKVPKHWGIICIEEDTIRIIRPAKPNRSVSRRAQLTVLWKLELKNILIKNNLPLYAQREKGYISDRIKEAVDEKVLGLQIAYELLHRDYSIYDAKDYSIHLHGEHANFPMLELFDILSESDSKDLTLDKWIEIYHHARKIKERKDTLFIEEPKTKRIPHKISYKDIKVSLGAPWIDVNIINDFISHLLGYSEGIISARCKYEPVTGNWHIEQKRSYDDRTNATVTYGTMRYNALFILEDSLNLREIHLRDKSGKYEEAETIAALEKQKKIEQEFKNWIWLSEDRRWAVEEAYNKMFDSYKVTKHNGSHLRFENMNGQFSLYPYQKDAVQKILDSKNTLLAFDVGAGKTYIMIAAAMEMRNAGISRRNLFVVPNHIVGQWEKIFTDLYPQAKVLAIEPKIFKPEMRQKVLRQIKEGDYDGIIIAYSCFEQIPLSENTVLDNMNRRLKIIEDAIYVLRTTTKYDRWNQKVLEKEKNRMLKLVRDFLQSMDRPADNYDVTFEDLEISTLFLDEAHNYKNLPIKTSMMNLNGINTRGSKKCLDMLHKVRCVQNSENGRGAVFATGTPLSNSISDAYNMQVYLQYEDLKQSNLDKFDNWVKTFAKPEQLMEIDVNASKYRSVRKFSRFFNLPELSRMFSQIAVFYAIDKKDALPEFEGYTDIVIPKFPELTQYMASLCKRTEEIRSGKIDRKYDNMLKVSTDGRKAALDLSLVGALQPYNQSSKIYRCIQNVMKIYSDFAGCTQIIFCDYSTPRGDDFSVYREIKTHLIELGVPDSEIAFIHSYHTESRKIKLFNRFNAGEVRILIGSTLKLGIGANVQIKLKAIHHLDVPWRPADVGRILRTFKIKKNVEVTDNGKDNF